MAISVLNHFTPNNLTEAFRQCTGGSLLVEEEVEKDRVELKAGIQVLHFFNSSPAPPPIKIT